MSDNSGFSAQPVTGTAIGYRWWDLFLNGGGPEQIFLARSYHKWFPASLRGMGGLVAGSKSGYLPDEADGAGVAGDLLSLAREDYSAGPACLPLVFHVTAGTGRSGTSRSTGGQCRM